MSIFKCKMCGATLNITKDTNVFKCEYCDTEQTVPVINSQEKEDLYERANYFFHNNEYDKAAKIYEEISNLDPRDPESYFMQSLCKYGIEYVEDPKSKKRIPTLHRLHFESISNDVNYKKAIKHADTAQKVLYEYQAKYIDEVRNKILDISKKEKPYDVFICYKETDEKGQRTEDSVIAMDIYNELTKEGLKVFFSRVTLEGKLGVEYEPYIFAALNSAKVMVVVGTKPEYINSPWVRNEWSRFIDRIDGSKTNKKNAEKCYIVPAYKGMSPYALPNEFSSIQSQDMSKVGATQDLVHGIKKLLNKKIGDISEVKPQLNIKEKMITIGVALFLLIISTIFAVNLINKPAKKITIRGVEYTVDKGYNSLTLNDVNDFGEEDVNKLNRVGIIKTLYFRNCELENLDFLSKLKNVNGLYFSATKINDLRSSGINENIKSIEFVNNNNSILDSIEFLNSMPNLEKIIIVIPRNNDLSPISNHNKLLSLKLINRTYSMIENYSWCYGLTNLKELEVTSSSGSITYTSEEPFKGINHLNNLEHISIRGNKMGKSILSENDLKYFSELRNLISIDISISGSFSYEDITVLSFKHFDKLFKLEKLVISANNRYDLNGLDNLFEIKEIDLKNGYLINENLYHIKNLNKLKSLSIKIGTNYYSSTDSKKIYFSFKGIEGKNNLMSLKVILNNPSDIVTILDEDLLKNIEGLHYQIVNY